MGNPQSHKLQMTLTNKTVAVFMLLTIGALAAAVAEEIPADEKLDAMLDPIDAQLDDMLDVSDADLATAANLATTDTAGCKTCTGFGPRADKVQFWTPGCGGCKRSGCNAAKKLSPSYGGIWEVYCK